ncbi:hypothetical protein HA402_005277 [Bradysia odoriphaga]|nr:hypothetical protein HA402_005277 [Bradysia odoriphaga]
MFRNMAQIDIKLGVQSILLRVNEAFAARNAAIKTKKPMLVAVSKTKPAEAILEAYETGQRDFGENYVNELKEKGANPTILENCKDIRWHFIGHLQSSNVNKVLKTPGIYMIETIDSEKLATTVNNSWEKITKPNKEPLKVLVQVNTSSEDAKSGVDPSNVVPLCKYIRDTCTNLRLEGLMTIGKFGHDYTTGPNPDFISLMKCHSDVCQAFGLNEADVEVSMGMSDDFDEAIKMGSTIVRVGSSIFGYRQKKEN